MTEKNVSMEKSESAGQARAFGLFLSKRYEEAVAVYDDLLKKNPDNLEFWLNRQICRLKYSSVSASFFDEMIRRLKDLPAQGFVCLAEVLNSLGRKTEALVFADKALEKESENITAYVLKARFLIELKRVDEAFVLMQSVYPRFKTDERVLVLMAFYACAIENLPQAKHFLKKALKTNKTAAIRNDLFYRAMLSTGQYAEILKYGEEALNAGENDPAVISVLIKAATALGEYEKAEAFYWDLSSLTELTDAEKIQWAELLIRLRGYDEAFDLLLTLPRDFEKRFIYLQDLFYTMRQDGLDEESWELARILEKQGKITPEERFICDVALSNEDRTKDVPLSLARLTNDRNAESQMEASFDFSYNLPFFLEEALHYLEVPIGQSLHVLDLGCGTGAMVSVLENYSRPAGTLTGVDISPEVLNYAAAQEKYGELKEADLVSFCEGKEQAKRYDLIVCMNALPYFSYLMPVFKAVKKALKPGGLFIFSIQPTNRTGRDFIFDNGSFCHGAAYVLSCLKSARLYLEHRQEGALYKGEDIPCHVFAARKKK